MQKLNKLCLDIFGNKILITINANDIELNFEKYYNITEEYDERTIINNIYIKKIYNSSLIISTNFIKKQFYIYMNDKDSTQIEVEVFDYINHFARLILNNDYYFLHASMVEKNNYGYIVIGRTHSGKSTTAINLLKYGYNYVTDDIVGINKKNGKVIGINKPIYIRNSNLVKIEDTGILKIKSKDNLYHYLYSNINNSEFTMNNNIILLKKCEFNEGKKVDIKIIDGAQKILELISNTFNEIVNKKIIIDFNKLFKNCSLFLITYCENIDIADLIIERNIFENEKI